MKLATRKLAVHRGIFSPGLGLPLETQVLLEDFSVDECSFGIPVLFQKKTSFCVL
jgi:hypothetical protein